jgi:hypothetical protein
MLLMLSASLYLAAATLLLLERLGKMVPRSSLECQGKIQRLRHDKPIVSDSTERKLSRLAEIRWRASNRTLGDALSHKNVRFTESVCIRQYSGDDEAEFLIKLERMVAQISQVREML